MKNLNLIDLFWKSTSDGVTFKLFSLGHNIALFIILAIIFLIYVKKDKLRNEKIRKRIGWILGIILFLQQFFLYYWYIDSGNFSVKDSLPLYTCRIAILLSIFMCIKGNYSIFEFVYFWGLGGAILALLTPDTDGFLFPHWMYIQFFIGHGTLLISIVFMLIVYEYRPYITSLKKTIKWTFLYLFTVGGLNYLVDGNYSYLRQKPSTATILDRLPPYPYYVPILVSLIILFFFILYIPFYIKDLKQQNLDLDVT